MKLVFAGAMVAGALLVGAAGPKPEPKSESIWTKTPTPEQISAALPDAVRRGDGGAAAMRGKVTADAGLSDCRPVQESPVGIGFAQALLALAPEYRVRATGEGAPAVGSEVVAQIDTLRADTAPDWVRKPSWRDLLVVWPKEAWAAGFGGKALIQCLVSVQGALYDCIVASETPPGKNFGSAAIALTPQFLMRPATLQGKPVVSVASIPINFAWQGGARSIPDAGSTRSMVHPVMAWPEAPSYAAVASAYPQKARATNVGGRATVNCEFTKQGRLINCHIVTEEPKGLGFGDAAKVLAKQFRAFPNTSTGAPLTGAGVQLPVVFDPAMLAGGKPVIGKAQWIGLPSAEDTRSAFSRVESGHGTVRVMLACVVQQGGGVSNCSVEREEPAGIGVGQAALALAPRFRLSTWTAEGLPTVGGTINIPLRYEGGIATAPAAKP
jgi:TonB family protein